MITVPMEAMNNQIIQNKAQKAKKLIVKHSPKIIAFLSLMITGVLYIKQDSQKKSLKTKVDSLSLEKDNLALDVATRDNNLIYTQNRIQDLEEACQKLKISNEDKNNELKLALEEIEDLKATVERQKLRLQMDL